MTLPPAVSDKVFRFLKTDLPIEPTRHLRRVGGSTSRAGLQCACRVPEQGNPPTVHICLFRVRYSQDKRILIVYDCRYFPLRR